MPIETVKKTDLHEFWQSRIYTARNRLQRTKKETKWARWAQMADMEREDRFHFAESARRDLRLDVIGERPVITLEAYRNSDARMELPQTRLAEIELDREENWDALTRVADDASLAGIGWIRADWFVEGELDESNLSEEEESAARQEAQQEAAQLLAGQAVPVNPESAHSIHIAVKSDYLDRLGVDATSRGLLEANIKAHKDLEPTMPAAGFKLTRVNPADMIFDDTAIEFRYVDWIAERVVKRVEDVKNDPDLKNTANLVGKSEVKRRGYRKRRTRRGSGYAPGVVDSGRGGSTVGALPAERYEVLWYIHDFRDNKLIVIAEEHPDKKVLKEEDWPYPDVTYYPLVFDHARDSIEGISDYAKMEYPAKVRSDIQERWVQHIGQHSRRKVIHTKQFLDEKGKAAFNDPAKTLVEVEAIQGQHAVLEDVPINPDAYRVDSVMQDNINRFIGSSDVHQGVGKNTASATEASIVDAARGRVIQERRGKISRMLTWVLRQMFAYYKMFGTEKIFLQRGASPDKDLILDPEDLTEDMWITIDTDSLSAANRELQRQQIRQAIEVINASPWMMELLGEAGMTELLRQYLRAQGLIKNPDALLQEAAAQREAMGQMMPIADEAARKAGGGGPTTPGRLTGRSQAGPQTLNPGGPNPTAAAGVPGAASQTAPTSV